MKRAVVSMNLSLMFLDILMFINLHLSLPLQLRSSKLVEDILHWITQLVALIQVGRYYNYIGEALGTCNPKMSQKNVEIRGRTSMLSL